MKIRISFIAVAIASLAPASYAAQSANASPPPKSTSAPVDMAAAFPPKMQTFALYGESPIPNSKPSPDEESGADRGFLRNVSRPQLQVYLPAKMRANGTSVLIFPGGGYAGLTFDFEGTQQAQFFVDHGIAAFIVKYRIPSDTTMVDKSIGPLQDAQQAMRLVRSHAKEWNLDPSRIGAIGFSAGGHLAATLATHSNKAYIANPDGTNLRPDFLIVVYPVISMDKQITHSGSREALLGPNLSEAQVRFFSNELQVSNAMPPTLILHATDDQLVDVENSVRFYESLRHAGVPVEMHLFEKGQHGFFLMPRDRWQSTILDWLRSEKWL